MEKSLIEILKHLVDSQKTSIQFYTSQNEQTAKSNDHLANIENELTNIEKTIGGLYKFFDNPPAPLDQIEPHHIARYRDWRAVTSSTKEIALSSVAKFCFTSQGQPRSGSRSCAMMESKRSIWALGASDMGKSGQGEGREA